VSSPAQPVPPAIERYFQVSLFLLLLTGFSTLAATGKLTPPAVLFVGVALVTRAWLLARGREWLLSERAISLATVAYIPFYIFDFLFLSVSFVTASVHLVLFTMVVKLFSVRRDRDHLYLATLAFLMVLASAVLTVDSVFLAAFSLFLLLAVTTFISLEMRRSAAAATGQVRGASPARRRFARSLSATAALLVGGILVASAFIFFVLPRTSIRYLSQFAPRNELVSGFSDDVRLGQIGEIKLSNAVVMHVQIEGDPEGAYDLLWRGTTLTDFDGSRWSLHSSVRYTLEPRFGQFYIGEEMRRRAAQRGEPMPPLGRPLRYRVLMEPIGTNVFFLAGTTEVLSGNYRLLAIGPGDALFNFDRGRNIARYEVSASLPPSEAHGLPRVGTGGETLIRRYLDLPSLDPRVHELAQQVTSEAADDFEKGVALEQHLKTRYGYTLMLPPTVPEDPIAHFLFERREGHCEYFASAMAVMLRALGIPSRMVNGFRTGEFNDVTGSYIIRARDAHSWVEAWVPGRGWITFDPTPPDPVPPKYAYWSRMLLYVDAAREFWREWVVNYDFGHQRTLGQQINVRGREVALETRQWFRQQHRDLIERAKRWRDEVLDAPVTWSFGAAGLLALLLLAVNARRLWRSLRAARLARRPGTQPSAAASIWYSRLTRWLARRGWRRLPAQTPQEFAASVDDARLQGPLAEFTQNYEKARFGDSAEAAERLPELFEEITTAGRK
jgi:transglutaminase-like putative cysteine protease